MIRFIPNKSGFTPSHRSGSRRSVAGHKHLSESTRPLLDAPWILDIDTTIKPLYGHQQGSVVSYNPHKPGRPSHSYHTYLMAGLRLVLGMDVKAGNEHSANHSLPGLLHLLDGLAPE